MFNTFNFNTTPFNSLVTPTPATPVAALVFNNYGLQTSDIVTQILIQDNTPERSFETSAVPRGDGEIITGDFWRRKTVKARGVIHKTTNALLEAELDAMKKALSVAEGNLDITIAGTVRRYIATMTSGNNIFNERKGYHITFCPFEVEFLCLTPFGQSPGYVSSGYLGQTSLSLDEQVDNLGTVRSKPVVILNFTAASGITQITFTNNTRNEAIRLTANITAGDYVKFDSENLEVTINGVIQDYDGAFPLLDTGANSFTIDIAGTSATYDLTVKQKTCYL